jgi:hypothetical protein
VRSAAGPDHIEVLFLQSARIYRLLTGRPGFDAALRTLQNAEAEGGTVVIGLDSLDSDVIEEVHTHGVAPPTTS